MISLQVMMWDFLNSILLLIKQTTHVPNQVHALNLLLVCSKLQLHKSCLTATTL